MYKVVLIDDEPWMLEGLRTMIDWRSTGFEVCGEAMDGEDGLALIKTLQPDLVVTDIRMPVIDGLELLRLTRNEQLPQAKFIVLSGYDEFAYARTALSHEASTYLLKPLDPDEFHPVLHQLKTQLDEARHKESEQEREIASLIRQLLSGSSRSEEQHAILQRVEAFLGANDHTVVRCVIVEHQQADARCLKLSMLDESVFACRRFLFDMGASQFGLLLLEESPDLVAGLASLYDSVSGQCGEGLSLFVSEPSQGVQALIGLYHQTLKARSDSRASAAERQAIYFCRPGAEAALSYDFYEGGESLLRCIELMDVEGIRQSVQSAFRSFRSSRSAPSVVQAFLSNLVVEIVNRTGSSLFYSLARLQEGHSALEQNVLDYCLEAAAQLADRRGQDSVIADAKAYAEQHYGQRLKLTEVAELLHIQPAYLGQRFKKEIGVSFNEYVHATRIEEAKKLLRRTDMKIADIARSVGYKDDEDFVKQFKAHVRVLPSAYKKG